MADTAGTRHHKEKVCVTDSYNNVREQLHKAMPPSGEWRIWASLKGFLLNTLGLPFFRILNVLYPLIRVLDMELIVLFFARRWVAGKSVDSAMHAIRKLKRQGLTYTLDILGEEVKTDAGADTALASYCSVIERLAREFQYRQLSVKLSQLGLVVSSERCENRMRSLLDVAAKHNAFVTIDMEQYALKESTIAVFSKLFAEYENVGICIQAYLHDTPHDLHRLIALSRREGHELFIRLAKGAYVNQEAEWAKKGHYPNPVVPSKEQTDAQYLLLAEEMLGNRDIVYSAFATHDEAMIVKILHIVEAYRISRKQFEFQQLYGIRHELAQGLANMGHHTRIYVPFGSECIPYVTRRLLSNPANLNFVVQGVRGK